MLQKGEKYCL